MKNWRLISGSLNSVFFIIMLFQSCGAGVVNGLSEKWGDNSGSFGLLCAALILVAAVLSIAFRNSPDEGHGILTTLYSVAAVIGIFFHGIFKDLIVWGSWSAICAVVTVLFAVLSHKQRAAAAAAMPVIENPMGVQTNIATHRVSPEIVERDRGRTAAMVVFILSCVLGLAGIFGIFYIGITEAFPIAYLYGCMGGTALFGIIAYALAGKAFD